MNKVGPFDSLRQFGLPLFLALLLWALIQQPAHADLLISPQRVVLDQNTRQAVISLHNPGTLERHYRIEWVERRLTDEGELLAIPNGENPLSLATMVRFSPRRVSVAPGATQTIRLDYRPPAGLASGEYRSHLLIKQEPRTDGQGGTEVMRGEQEGLSFRLDAMLSFAVPIFARHGEGSAQASILAVEPSSQIRDGKSEPALKVTLGRSGEFSSYGRLVIYQQMNANSPVEQISEMGGVALYREVNSQQKVVSLKPGTQLAPGSSIRVTYEGEGAERGRVFAEKAFRIGN